MKKKFWQDRNIEVFIGNLLRTGVVISSCVIFIGGIIYLYRHGGSLPDYHSFHGMNHSFYSLPLVFTGVLHGRGAHIIQLGVLILIATPVARVAFSIFGFAEEGDRLYIAITLLVLIIILTSMFLGLKA